MSSRPRRSLCDSLRMPRLLAVQSAFAPSRSGGHRLRRVRVACQPTLAQRAKAGADDQNRTGDLVLTKDALCQLSYIGLRRSHVSTRATADKSARSPSACQPSTFALRATVDNLRRRARWLANRSSRSERRLERETGIEPATNSLEGCDSTTELLPPSRSHSRLALRRASPPSRSFAFDPRRRFTALTRLTRLPLDSLRPIPPSLHRWLAQPKLARCMRAKVGGEGRTRTFEAARATDLQSAAFDRFATSPIVCVLECAAVRHLPAGRTVQSMELAKGFEPPTC